jgi:hypothetical protein
MKFLLIFAMVIFNLSTAFAVPAKQIVRPQKLGNYIAAGAIVGGNAGKIFSLLRVQKMLLAGGVERLILTYGDQDGVPLKTQPGYFHLSLDQAGERLVLDLSQVMKTAIDQQDLIKELRGSHLVAKTDMSMDPQDGTTNITLFMRTPVETRAQIEMAEDKQNQIVIDIRPVSKH